MAKLTLPLSSAIGILCATLVQPSLLLAAEEGSVAAKSQPLDYYDMVLEHIGAAPMWAPTVGAVLCTVIVLALGFAYKSSVDASGDQVVPGGRFGVRFVVEGILDFMVGLAKDNTHAKWRSYLPLFASIFIFILVCNLSGLIPGFPPPTESMDTNVAIGLVVFFVYNIAGLREHGFAYIKHFLGPVVFIAPLFFCIELVSHGSRPLSLGLRLMGNIYGDHTLLGVFTQLTYIGFPALLMFFGLLVAVVQSFVFVLLSGIYISMAISHDH